METILATTESPTSQSQVTANDMFNCETFSSGNGDEIAVEPLESISDGKDENCKQCQ